MGFDVAGLSVSESDGDLLVTVRVQQQIASEVSVDLGFVSNTATLQQGQLLTIIIVSERGYFHTGQISNKPL